MICSQKKYYQILKNIGFDSIFGATFWVKRLGGGNGESFQSQGWIKKQIEWVGKELISVLNFSMEFPYENTIEFFLMLI